MKAVRPRLWPQRIYTRGRTLLSYYRVWRACKNDSRDRSFKTETALGQDQEDEVPRSRSPCRQSDTRVYMCYSLRCTVQALLELTHTHTHIYIYIYEQNEYNIPSRVPSSSNIVSQRSSLIWNELHVCIDTPPTKTLCKLKRSKVPNPPSTLMLSPSSGDECVCIQCIAWQHLQH